jgi:hypothetical protein
VGRHSPSVIVVTGEVEPDPDQLLDRATNGRQAQRLHAARGDVDNLYLASTPPRCLGQHLPSARDGDPRQHPPKPRSPSRRPPQATLAEPRQSRHTCPRRLRLPHDYRPHRRPDATLPTHLPQKKQSCGGLPSTSQAATATRTRSCPTDDPLAPPNKPSTAHAASTSTTPQLGPDIHRRVLTLPVRKPSRRARRRAGRGPVSRPNLPTSRFEPENETQPWAWSTALPRQSGPGDHWLPGATTAFARSADRLADEQQKPRS